MKRIVALYPPGWQWLGVLTKIGIIASVCALAYAVLGGLWLFYLVGSPTLILIGLSATIITFKADRLLWSSASAVLLVLVTTLLSVLWSPYWPSIFN